jgi:disulfide bond formation protein DsbB
MLLSLVGFVVLIVSKNNKLRYVFVHICLAGAGTGGPVVVAWLTDNTPDKGTRSLIIGFNGYSNIAGVIAGQLFKKKYAPTYKRPLTITMILISLGCLGYLAMRAVLMFENKRRAKVIAGWTDEQYEEERRTTERRGDHKLTFVYGY